MSYINYPTPTAEEAKNMGSEIEKYRHLVAPHCAGCGVDLGSQGVACVPWGLSVDLPQDRFLHYSNGNLPKGPIPIRADITQRLTFDSDSLDWICCSHVIEDFSQEVWPKLFSEWGRCLKHGGKMILLIPDHERWWEYVNAGGVHNFAHFQPQPNLGDLTAVLTKGGWKVLSEEYTDVYPRDFNILAVAIKP
jgi:SAM-dependent methyltransferase